MLQQFKIACAFHLWARALAWLGLGSMAMILLAKSLPLMGRLLVAHGLSALASFIGVSLLSLTWGMAWAMLLWVGIGLLCTGKKAKGTRSKTKWQRISADNLLEQGFDEPQA